MIDLVLQDAGVPASGIDLLRNSKLVEIVHPDPAVSRHLGGVSGDAEAALEEIDLRVAVHFQPGINEYVEGNALALALAQLFAAPGAVVLLAILDDGKLNAESDLRCRQADSGRLAKRFQHVGNRLLHISAQNLFLAKRTCGLPQDGLSNLDDI